MLPKNEKRNVNKLSQIKIWIYGAPFSGKTTLANNFPDALMLNTDGNINSFNSPYVRIRDEIDGRQTVKAWVIFKRTIEELNSGVKVVELAYIMIPKIQIRQKKTENTVNFYHRLDEELEKAEVKKIIVEYDENKTNEFLLDCEVIKNTTDFIKRESSFCRFCNFYDYCQKGLTCDIIEKTK